MHPEIPPTIIAESRGASFSASRSPPRSLPRPAASFWRIRNPRRPGDRAQCSPNLFSLVFGETLWHLRREHYKSRSVRIRTDFSLDNRAGRQEHPSTASSLLQKALPSEKRTRRQRFCAPKDKQWTSRRFPKTETSDPTISRRCQSLLTRSAASSTWPTISKKKEKFS